MYRAHALNLFALSFFVVCSLFLHSSLSLSLSLSDASTMISVVLINQFVGPVLCKKALQSFGEAGKMSGAEDEHGEHAGGPKKRQRLKRAVLFGLDATSLYVAAKLLKAGWRVSLVAEATHDLLFAKALGIAKRDTNYCMDGGDTILLQSAVDAPAGRGSAAVFHDGSGQRIAPRTAEGTERGSAFARQQLHCDTWSSPDARRAWQSDRGC